jgi:hypothetical protein
MESRRLRCRVSPRRRRRPSVLGSSLTRQGRNPGTTTSTTTLRCAPTRKLQGRIEGEKSSNVSAGLRQATSTDCPLAAIATFGLLPCDIGLCGLQCRPFISQIGLLLNLAVFGCRGQHIFFYGVNPGENV